MSYTNALIHETSPYLLQHAHNPVQWLPWGEEAFEKAKREEKPVFLSIGYSTCHWCHVMEQESFEDMEVAALLNRSFVPVKVDREERPDIDSVYMSVCQALTGAGGWPLTILMTPEQKPFFAGTYFPRRRRHGRIGLIELLETVEAKWRVDRRGLLESGEQIAAAFSGEGGSSQAIPDGRGVATAAFHDLSRSFDNAYGGFGGPPKFPMPHQLLFLLRCHYLGIGTGGLEMVEKTLTCMYKGGIYDHIGGGFSRYSTDERWLAPHFEKMLYDNALLTIALLECYQVTGSGFYRGVAERTLGYISREMTAPEGGFYCAQDADVAGDEGKFYTFTKSEILDVLGREGGQAFCARYGVCDEGNFEGTNILNLLHCQTAKLPGSGLERQLHTLLQYRAGRYTLHRDDKMLTSWNALMTAAFARAYRVLGNGDYLALATEAYRFLARSMTGENGGLLISYRGGRAKGVGLLDDYAYLTWACLELYESTFEAAYLQRACSLMEQVLSRFGRRAGGFYLSPEDGEPLLLRPVEWYDGALPCGNSAAAFCLSRLSSLTGEARWREAAQRQLAAYGELFEKHPTSCTFALLALLQESFPTGELLCALPNENQLQSLALEWGRRFHPLTTVVAKSPGEADGLAQVAPYTISYPLGGGAAYYLCRNYSCSAPVRRLEEVLPLLER